MDIIIETTTGTSVSSVSRSAVLSMTLIILAIYIVFYVLRSIGVYKLAKGQGVDKAFFAWIPCLWMFTACKIIGKARFFGTPAENVAVWVCVFFSVAVIVPFITEFLRFFPYVAYYLEGGTLTMNLSEGMVISAGTDFVNNFDTPAINAVIKILSALGYLLRIAEIFITVSIYIALFKKFWPQHYILAAVLSFFGLFGIFVFAIRNNKPIDFNEYIRRRYYNAGFTPYGNGYYNQGGGSGADERGTPYGSPSEEKEPFGEFSDRPDEPFGEFSDGKNGKNDKDDKKDKDDKSGDYFQ
ncbi:MAG: hypothetical protein J6Y43_07330 [Clostridia bacterium]|nr:hypothetical protein [Clostridia bacterium]